VRTIGLELIYIEVYIKTNFTKNSQKRLAVLFKIKYNNNSNYNTNNIVRTEKMKTASLLLGKIAEAKGSSDFKKRLLALFILGAMIINGFGLSVSEAERAGKWSAALIAVAVGQNVVTTVFKKCNKALTCLSNDISGYIKGLIFGADEQRGAASNKKESKEESGGQTTAGNAIVNEYRKAAKAKIITLFGWAGGFREAVILYMENKISDGAAGWALVLVFIMFIIGVIHRKVFGDIAAAISSIDSINNNY
jgi:hypothetical protein